MSREDPLAASPYVAYLYAYPHKTAYRRLDPPVRLDRLWAEQDQSALFLYLHVPFCEMRCGFCNLFTQAKPKDQVVEAYLDALERQTVRKRETLGDPCFARVAVGGGTPTYLTPPQLERAFDLLARMGADVPNVPTSVETSPETATAERLTVLVERGVNRISIGVQSFDDAEVRSIARPQQASEVDAALERIRAAGFGILNVDLMYGLPEQSTKSWLFSLRHALSFAPEEIYLYPLYVRPLTGLGRRGTDTWDQQRLEHYREGRALLSSEGYEQMSMRMFQKRRPDQCTGTVYRCQEDGMVGLGPGARSYTDTLHYSTEYAVGARGVREIIEAYNRRTEESFGLANYGFVLDGEDRRRRYVILSLLERGLDLDAYRARFHSEALEDLPALDKLRSRELATLDARRLRLTDRGVERSDAIGPWLFSENVAQRMRSYALR